MRNLKIPLLKSVFLLVFLLLSLRVIYSEDLTETPTMELLEEWEKILNSREQILNERDENLLQKESDLNKKEATLNGKENSLNQRETSINARETLINEQEQYFKNLRGDNLIDKITFFGLGFIGGFATGGFAGFKVGVEVQL